MVNEETKLSQLWMLPWARPTVQRSICNSFQLNTHHLSLGHPFDSYFYMHKPSWVFHPLRALDWQELKSSESASFIPAVTHRADTGCASYPRVALINCLTDNSTLVPIYVCLCIPFWISASGNLKNSRNNNPFKHCAGQGESNYWTEFSKC